MPKPKARQIIGNLKPVIFTGLFVASWPVMADDAPVSLNEFNVTCPASRLLPVLDAAYHACNNGYVDGSCEKFVSVYKKLLPTYDCQRPFDNTSSKRFIVPGIWLAVDGAMEDYIHLLWRIASRERMYDKWFPIAVAQARALFASEQFRHTLDGALAEDWSDKSEQMARGSGK